MQDAARVQPPTDLRGYRFAHVNRISVRCYYCGCQTRNAMETRSESGERIKICRKKKCRR